MSVIVTFNIKHFRITYRVGNNVSGVAVATWQRWPTILRTCNSHRVKGLALYIDSPALCVNVNAYFRKKHDLLISVAPSD